MIRHLASAASRIKSATRTALRAERGFTMIEMMTVLTIIFILMSVVVLSTQVGNRRQQLRDAAAGYIAAARNAESLAGGSRAILDPVSGETKSRKAYGLCIAGTTGTCTVPPGEEAVSYQVYGRPTAFTGASDADERPDNADVVTTFRLPDGLVFEEADIYLDYLPPAPRLLVNGGERDDFVRIKHESVTNCAGSGDCLTIRIKPRAGAVYVQ